MQLPVRLQFGKRRLRRVRSLEPRLSEGFLPLPGAFFLVKVLKHQLRPYLIFKNAPG